MFKANEWQYKWKRNGMMPTTVSNRIELHRKEWSRVKRR